MKNKKMKIEQVKNNELEIIEKILGKNIINFANNNERKIDVIPTGSISLNQALGIGGYPVGKFIEIYGNESCGKTTLTLHAIKEAQTLGKKCMFIDVENSLDVKYLENIGVDTSKLYVAHPKSGEQVFDIMEYMISNDKVDVIVVDSVAAMIPLAEAEAKVEDQQMGVHARMMSKGMRRIQSLMINHECTVFFINQIREKIGVFFGNPETTTGGKALRFFSSIRLEVRKAELIKESNDKIGIQTKVTVTKNKMAAPLKVAYIDIYFQNGFNYENEIIDFAIQYNVIAKSGSWYSYNDSKLGQGKEQLKKYLTENKDVFEAIKAETLAKISNEPTEEPSEDKTTTPEAIEEILDEE